MEAFIHLTRPSDRSPSALKIPNRRKFNASSYIISPVCITYSIGFSIVPTSVSPSSPLPSSSSHSRLPRRRLVFSRILRHCMTVSAPLGEARHGRGMAKSSQVNPVAKRGRARRLPVLLGRLLS